MSLCTKFFTRISEFLQHLFQMLYLLVSSFELCIKKKRNLKVRQRNYTISWAEKIQHTTVRVIQGGAESAVWVESCI